MEALNEKGLQDTTPAAPINNVTSNDDPPNIPHGRDDENTINSELCFLKLLHGDGPHYLVALKKGKSPTGARFTSDQGAEMQRWAKQQNQHGRNVYFHPAVLKDDFHLEKTKDGNKKFKAEKTDVVASRWVWVDCDPPDDCLDATAWRIRTLEALRAAEPTLIVDSGRGYWGYWKDELADLKPPKGLKIFEAKLKLIRNCFKHLNADSLVTQAATLARLPYTINQKSSRLATVVHYNPGAVFDETRLPQQVVALSDQARSTASPPLVSLEDMARIIRFLKDKGCFSNYGGVQKDADGKIISIGWIEAGMALKLAYLDDGLPLWELTFDGTVTDEERDSHWASFATDYKPGHVTINSLIKAAADLGYREVQDKNHDDGAPDFNHLLGYVRECRALNTITGNTWPMGSVDAIYPMIFCSKSLLVIKAGQWLLKHRPVHEMTWAPGEPQIIVGKLLQDGGWINEPGYRTFNKYRPPNVDLGDPSDVDPWLNHLKLIYPHDWPHIVYWMAHRRQKPGEKINHAIVLGGEQGIGKDTLLKPIEYAVGHWNVKGIEPKKILNDFNPYTKSVLLRIDEAHDTGENMSRYKLYEALKTIIAAPPDVLTVNEKHLHPYSIPNVCGVVITTNHKEGGMYLPPGDRRHYVAWSDKTKADFSEEYWNDLWNWYYTGGIQNVCAYLDTLDISGFNPKANPPQTPAWRDIVSANVEPEVAELKEVIEELGETLREEAVLEQEGKKLPRALTIEMITDKLKSVSSIYDQNDLYSRLTGGKYRRHIPEKMKECGYVKVNNPGRKSDDLWPIKNLNNKCRVIYALKSLGLHEQIEVARTLADND